MARTLVRLSMVLIATCVVAGILTELWTWTTLRQHITHLLHPHFKEWDAGVPLRIMPLGDSITEGYMSSDGNGYRLNLQNLLKRSGNEVELVGTMFSGKNEDNWHEGYGGAKILSIAHNTLSRDAILMHPNLILVHVGTNDLQDKEPGPGESVKSTPRRLQLLLDIILCENPTAVIIVAQIIQQQPCQECVDTFNVQLPALVAEYVQHNYKVHVANFSGIGSPEEMADGLHPNDSGYKKMAQLWYEAIQDVPSEWIAPPAPPITSTDPRTCHFDPQHWYDMLANQE